MKNPKLLFVLVVLSVGAINANMVCYYDSSSYIREGPAQVSLAELEPALQFCNTLVYGYAGIDAESYQLKPLNAQLDISRDHYRTVTALKRKNPQLRVLLSVGGDKDIELTDAEECSAETNKYLLLLEQSAHRQAFITSAQNVLRTYGFDGLDLAWQFPKNHPKQVKSGVKKAWGKFTGWFKGPKPVDEKAEEHKEQFTSLVRELKTAFGRDASMLTLTILPSVNAALFIDVPTVVANLDFVNLATFDFQTPLRDPKVADYPASLYELYERSPESNINFQVQYWLNNTAPANKIHIGIASYGRTWVMSKDSGITGYPPITEATGVAPGGKHTVTPGILSWPEICEKLNAHKDLTGDSAPLRKVGDPTKRFGTYAYRAADENGEHGMWVGYEDPTTAAIKASYVHAKSLGGVALFDLSMDDFRGNCAGEKYPILRSIKYKL